MELLCCVWGVCIEQILGGTVEGWGQFGVFAVQVLQWPRAVTFAQCGHLQKSTVMANGGFGKKGEFRLAEAGNDWHVLVRGSFLSGGDGTGYAEHGGGG